jgi:hypothetical protein
MENWVLCYTYGTDAVTLRWNMGILLTKITHGVCDPKELRTTTSCGNILCLSSGLSNARLFAGRSRHQRGSQKLASPRSGIPIQPTPSKIRVWKKHEAMLTVYICIKLHMDLQADKSLVVVNGPFFPRVVNPRYRICGTMCNARIQSSKARKAIFWRTKLHLI